LKRIFLGQLLELLFEPIVVFLVVLIFVVFAGQYDWNMGEALGFTISLWLTALLYRTILLQIPIAMLIKYVFSLRLRLTAWSVALINLVSLSGAFVAFDLMYGGAQAFLKGESLVTPVAIYTSTIVAPFLVAKIRLEIRGQIFDINREKLY